MMKLWLIFGKDKEIFQNKVIPINLKSFEPLSTANPNKWMSNLVIDKRKKHKTWKCV